MLSLNWVHGSMGLPVLSSSAWTALGRERGREGEPERVRKKGRYLVHIYIMLFTLDLADLEQIICTSCSE